MLTSYYAFSTNMVLLQLVLTVAEWLLCFDSELHLVH